MNPWQNLWGVSIAANTFHSKTSSNHGWVYHLSCLGSVLEHLTLPSNLPAPVGCLCCPFFQTLPAENHWGIFVLLSQYLTPKCVNHVENEWLPWVRSSPCILFPGGSEGERYCEANLFGLSCPWSQDPTQEVVLLGLNPIVLPLEECPRIPVMWNLS